MGTELRSEMDAWLSAGGMLVASSDRAARAVLRAYHSARRGEGRTAWTAPNVLPWQAFVRIAWEERMRDARLVLNAAQEQMLWERIAAKSGQPAAVLDGPRSRLAALAMEAHARICSFAPNYLDPRKRAGWDQDAGVWSHWLEEFDAACNAADAVSADRLPLALVHLLDEREPRPPLLLAGFDRLTLAQRRMLDAWGQWKNLVPGAPADHFAFYRATDPPSELAACAAWCRQFLEAGTDRRVLVIAQDVAERRGEMERAFLRENERGADLRFEFSLGVPLQSVAVARCADLLLRWLDGELAEEEVDWLLASGRAAVVEAETVELEAAMQAIRRRNRQRTHWGLRTFVAEIAPLAMAWANRMIAAQDRLADAAGRDRSPMEWTEVASQLLEAMGWPGARAQSSAEFQAARRWNQMVETCASLGFDARRMPWKEFAARRRNELANTLFAPESEDAPIVIVGPAESAGLQADAVWFLGANETAWPACGDMHPLLPPSVQRESGMPHASAALDWEIAKAITRRLISSAQDMVFSYAAQADGEDARPSRLVAQMAGTPQDLPQQLAAAPAGELIAVPHEDTSQVALVLGDAPHGAGVHGGASVITTQSQCPFKAFATARLRAQSWEPAEMSLTPAERGELVHAVLHAVWAGPPHGLRSLADLHAVADLVGFVAAHARAAMEHIPHRLREQMPAQYLKLEERRLARLITTWLEFERTRAEFAVEATELEKQVTVAGLPIKLRLDRLDRLNDGTFLVIDYKTGNVSDSAWDGERPEDLQLPLYAGFGLDGGQDLGGLVFARLRAGDMCFAGRVANAAITLQPALGTRSSLVKRPFEAEQLIDWRDKIEKLAGAFLAGHADVDPLQVKTCERCGLHVLCRIQEREPAPGEDEAVEEDADA